MRVTKTIRDYIDQEVTKRVRAKWEDELDEEKRQCIYLSDLQDACWEAAVNAYFTKASQLSTDFIAIERENDYCVPYSLCKAISLVHGPSFASKQMALEIADTVQNIVVELELGGDKAKLMELLNNI